MFIFLLTHLVITGFLSDCEGFIRDFLMLFFFLDGFFIF